MSTWSYGWVDSFLQLLIYHKPNLNTWNAQLLSVTTLHKKQTHVQNNHWMTTSNPSCNALRECPAKDDDSPKMLLWPSGYLLRKSNIDVSHSHSISNAMIIYASMSTQCKPIDSRRKRREMMTWADPPIHTKIYLLWSCFSELRLPMPVTAKRRWTYPSLNISIRYSCIYSACRHRICWTQPGGFIRLPDDLIYPILLLQQQHKIEKAVCLWQLGVYRLFQSTLYYVLSSFTVIIHSPKS